MLVDDQLERLLAVDGDDRNALQVTAEQLVVGLDVPFVVGDAGVRIIFNYSEALLQVPPEVTVHTSSPAVDLLYALYFYLT